MKYSEILVVLHKNKEYLKVASGYVINRLQWLEFQIDHEKDQAAFMCNILNLIEQKDLARLLVHLDYATYIPFGKKGEKQTEKWLKSKGAEMTFEQFKRNRMYIVLAQSGIKPEGELKQAIDDYCHFLVSDKQDFSKVESVVATIRQIGGELDNYVASDRVAGVSDRDDEMRIVLRNIFKDTKLNGKQFDIKNYLPKVNQNAPFERFEERYFEDITALKVPTNKDVKELGK